MPIYEYACSKCEKVTDVFQKLNDPPPQKCENCGAEGTLQRVVSRTSFVLKGGGWYADLYGSSKKSGESSGGSKASTTSSSASGSAASSTSSSASSSTSAPAAAKGGDK